MNRNCRRCGRYLAKLSSQRKGIGRTCARKERQKYEARFNEKQVAEARDIRRKRQIKKIRTGVYQVKSYLTARNICTCASGRYRGTYATCKHSLSVMLEEVTGV